MLHDVHAATRLVEDAALARRALSTMWQIRRFEEAVDDLFARGLMHGTMHLSIGQEAVPTGVCLALERERSTSHRHTAATATASPKARGWIA